MRQLQLAILLIKFKVASSLHFIISSIYNFVYFRLSTYVAGTTQRVIKIYKVYVGDVLIPEIVHNFTKLLQLHIASMIGFLIKGSV